MGGHGTPRPDRGLCGWTLGRQQGREQTCRNTARFQAAIHTLLSAHQSIVGRKIPKRPSWEAFLAASGLRKGAESA